MSEPRKEVLAEGVELWCGDCLDVLPSLGRFDAVVTDPPYGQNHKVNTFHSGGTREKAVVQRSGKTLRVRPNIHRPIVGDDRPFDPGPFVDLAPAVILWGAHKFADRLPPGTWLVWDKVPTGKVRDQGDGEAAWMKGTPRPMRIFRLLWDGLSVGTGARHEVTAGQQRLHPTQKPEVLMEWTLQQLGLPRRSTVIDPFMGVGSTGVAAVKAGLCFTGVEIDGQYFDIARRRVEAALKQPDFFIEAPKPAKQLSFIDGDAA